MLNSLKQPEKQHLERHDLLMIKTILYIHEVMQEFAVYCFQFDISSALYITRYTQLSIHIPPTRTQPTHLFYSTKLLQQKQM